MSNINVDNVTPLAGTTGTVSISGSLHVSGNINHVQHITASGNISASGTIIANNFQSAGGDVGGITFADDLNLTGDITASGNISSSGIINGNRLSQAGNLINDTFSPIAGHANIVTVGALNAGSITSGFTSIDVGSGAITTTGIVSTGTINASSHITASGNISSSGTITADEGSGNSFTVRPNLFFFATNTGVTDQTAHGTSLGDNEGSLPETNTTTVTLTQEQNSHSSIFSLSSNRITIARAGLYKLTYNATLEIRNGSNRNEGFAGIVEETSGGTVTLVDGSEGRGYHRFIHSSKPSGQTYAASCIVNVAADSIYDLRFGSSKQSLANQRLRTLPTGTSFLVEAIT